MYVAIITIININFFYLFVSFCLYVCKHTFSFSSMVSFSKIIIILSYILLKLLNILIVLSDCAILKKIQNYIRLHNQTFFISFLIVQTGDCAIRFLWSCAGAVWLCGLRAHILIVEKKSMNSTVDQGMTVVQYTLLIGDSYSISTKHKL